MKVTYLFDEKQEVHISAENLIRALQAISCDSDFALCYMRVTWDIQDIQTSTESWTKKSGNADISEGGLQARLHTTSSGDFVYVDVVM